MNLSWQYLLIFLGVTVEGPGVTLAAAALAGSGILDPYLVFLAAASGNVTGDLCWYMLGFFGRFERSLSWFPPLRRLEPQIARLKTRMNQHAPQMLLISKLSLGIGSIPTLIAAGLAHVAWWRVVPVQLVGETIWTGSLVLIGVFLGQYVARLERILQIAGIVGGAIFVAGLIFLLRKQFNKKTNCKQNGYS
jgi:membrane protein DedA with SNARE-associated domain